MKYKVLFYGAIFIISLTFSGCNNKDSLNEIQTNKIPIINTTKPIDSTRTEKITPKTEQEVDNFMNLKKGMNRKDLLAIYGEPLNDIGSGLHIYLYKTKDGMLTIYFDLNDKISKVDIQHSNGEIKNIVQ